MTEGPRNASRNRAARCWLPTAAFTLLLQAACSRTQPPALPAADLLLSGGTVYDGSEAAPRLLDVAVTGDRIVYVGKDAAPEHLAPMADYVHPRELSRAVEYLLVNGRLAIADGKLTGIAAGRVRLHTPTPGTCP